MRRVLLVQPAPSRETRTEFGPLGLASLAAYILAKHSPTLKVIDFGVETFSPQGWQRELEDFQPEVVGISLLTLHYEQGKRIAESTRKFSSHSVVVMGGVHATMEPEECLDYCDVVVRGEGEEALGELIEGEKVENIRGISYRKGGQVIHNPDRPLIADLDSLPAPAHHLFKVQRYGGFPGWGIMGSRGCPYKCTFCSSPRMWQRRVRLRSPQRICDEIEYLHHQLGIRLIHFQDDTLNIPPQRAIALCEEIINRNLHREVTFICQLRANRGLITPELVKIMAQSSFLEVAIGIESGSPKVLKSLGKDLAVEEAKEAVELCHRWGIGKVIGFFMVGNWDETPRDIVKTWRLAISSRVIPAFSLTTPYPGTLLYQKLKKEGYLTRDMNWGYLNQTTPVSRTNTMSRPAIFFFYACSTLLQTVLVFLRGGKKVHTIKRLIAYSWDTVKLVLPHLHRQAP